jgi:hypothetical protein
MRRIHTFIFGLLIFLISSPVYLLAAEPQPDHPPTVTIEPLKTVVESELDSRLRFVTSPTGQDRTLLIKNQKGIAAGKSGNNWQLSEYFSPGVENKYPVEIAAAYDANENLHLIFEAFNTDNRHGIFYTNFSTGKITSSAPTIEINSDAGAAENTAPKLAYSLQQRRLFSIFTSRNISGSTELLFTSRADDAPAWTNPKILSPYINTASSTAIITDKKGEPHIFWTEPGTPQRPARLFHQQLLEEGFTEPKDLNVFLRGEIKSLNTTIDPATGNLLLTFGYNGPGADLAIWNATTGLWSFNNFSAVENGQPAVLVTGATGATNPNPLYWLFWRDPTGQKLYYRVSASAGQSWKPLATISLPNFNISSFELATAPTGEEIYIAVNGSESNGSQNKTVISLATASTTKLLNVETLVTPTATATLTASPLPTTAAPTSPATVPSQPPTAQPVQPTSTNTPLPTAAPSITGLGGQSEVDFYVAAPVANGTGRGPVLVLPTATPVPSATPVPPTATPLPVATALPTPTRIAPTASVTVSSTSPLTNTNLYASETSSGGGINLFMIGAGLIALILIGKGVLNLLTLKKKRDLARPAPGATETDGDQDEQAEPDEDENEDASGITRDRDREKEVQNV